MREGIMAFNSQLFNILALMRMCGGQSARFLANNYENRIEVFLRFIDILPDRIVEMAEGDEETKEKTCMLVFCYGWLNPEGKFIPVRFAQHDVTVRQITGFDECDKACAAGWLKFTVGLPYNQHGECIFEPGADKRLVTLAQRNWLNEWLETIAQEETRPRFLKAA